MTPFTVREAGVLTCTLLTGSVVVGWGVGVMGLPVLPLQAAGIVLGPVAVIAREYAIKVGWWPF